MPDMLDRRALPAAIQHMLEDALFHQDGVGQSEAAVYLSPHQVLKIQPVYQESIREKEMLQWLQGRLMVPAPLAYEERDAHAYLLMTRANGIPAHEARWINRPMELLDHVANALRTLWQVDIRDCPYLHTLDVQFDWAASNIRDGRVDMDNVEPETFGQNGFSSPSDLLAWLRSNRPEEDLVFTHGDLSLPNILFQADGSPAFIDLGRAGVGDRWRDIAIVHKSLQANWTGHYAQYNRFEGYTLPMLLDRLGMTPDWKKIRYFLLMDELF